MFVDRDDGLPSVPLGDKTAPPTRSLFKPGGTDADEVGLDIAATGW